MGLTITRKLIITEARKPGEVFNKLSPKARKLAVFMSKAHERRGVRSFSVDDLRSSGFGGWRNIQELFFELESRRFGRVQRHEASTQFHAFVPAMQNISESVGFDGPLPDDDEFANPIPVIFMVASLRPDDWEHNTAAERLAKGIEDRAIGKVGDKLVARIGGESYQFEDIQTNNMGMFYHELVTEVEDWKNHLAENDDHRVVRYLRIIVNHEGSQDDVYESLTDVVPSHFSGDYDGVIVVVSDEVIT